MIALFHNITINKKIILYLFKFLNKLIKTRYLIIKNANKLMNANKIVMLVIKIKIIFLF